MHRSVQSLLIAATAFTAVLSALPSQAYAGGGSGGNPNAPAPTPEQIARRYTVRIQAVAEAAVRDLRGLALKTTQRIIRAVRAGAADDQITAIGADAITRITTRATSALERIDALKADALTRIADAGGSADAAALVEQAAINAAARVTQAKDNSTGRVNNAVTRATTPDPVPNP